MPVIPCPNKITCPGSDSPITNYSSEALDLLLFRGIGFPYLPPDIPFDVFWWAMGCLSLCESAVSQQDADACAAQQAFRCVHTRPSLPRTTPEEELFANNAVGCSSTCPDGLTFSYVTPPGKYTSTSQVLADRLAAVEACQFAVLAKICLSDLDPDHTCQSRNYVGTITISGGVIPFLVRIIAGSLPPGMNLSQSEDQRTITISGISPSPGNYGFTLRVDDGAGHFMQKSFTLKIPGVTNGGALPNTEVGDPYNFQFIASGGVPPYVFSDPGGTSGVWPDGITLHSNGLVTGSASFNGFYTFGVNVVDSEGHGCTVACTMLVGACNDLMSSTGFCPGDPSKTFHLEIPANSICAASKGQANALASAQLVNQIRIGLAAQGCVCPGPTVDLGAGTIGTVYVPCITSYAWNLNSPAIVNLLAGSTFDPFTAFHLFNGFDIPHGTPSILTPLSYTGPQIYMYYP